MPDSNPAQTQEIVMHAASSTLFGVGGGGLIYGLLRTLFNPVKPEDITMLKIEMSQVRAELYRDFLAKKDIEPLMEDIRQIRSRLEEIADKVR